MEVGTQHWAELVDTTGRNKPQVVTHKSVVSVLSNALSVAAKFPGQWDSVVIYRERITKHSTHRIEG